jgi:UDP-N-acetylglucosamine--N-acetylmuramyl-(pentapeptide) pyrophosphoryl-undecaprenol N-acetylglucosamine transferase
MITGKVLIVGGGTGGHISPGIALYEEFARQGVKALYLSGKKDRKFSLFREIDESDLFLYGAPPITKNIFKLPFFVMSFFASVFRVMRIISRNDIRAVIGMGGYVSAPALLAAKLKKVSIYLCEQNVIPGKVTSLFEKYSESVYGTFEESRAYLKNPAKLICAGNPIRKSVFIKDKKSEAKKAFHMNHAKKVVLVIGGSQGSMKMNEAIYNIKKKYNDQFDGIGIIWSAGAFSYDKFKSILHDSDEAGSIYLSPYIENVGMSYKAADIAISRAGAGVMMELAAFGVPSILIPYPFAALDHQNKNADAFVEAGAAVKVMEDASFEENLFKTLFSVLGNERLLNKMAEKAAAVSKKEAAETIVSDIIKKVK